MQHTELDTINGCPVDETLSKDANNSELLIDVHQTICIQAKSSIRCRSQALIQDALRRRALGNR